MSMPTLSKNSFNSILDKMKELKQLARTVYRMSVTPQQEARYIAKIFLIGASEELESKYEAAIEKHNQKVGNSEHPDSGFDIYTPEEATDTLNERLREGFHSSPGDRVSVLTVKADMQVKVAMYRVVSHDGVDKQIPTGYYMYARSSISKTDLRLANSVGIIDSGYRGSLIGMFDVLPRAPGPTGDGPPRLEAGHRLLQICAPDLRPFVVERISDESGLGATARGAGGFGSTGSA